MENVQSPRPVTFEQVYYVDGTQAASIPLNPIAIRPSIFNNKIKWFDTGRGRVIEATQIKCEPSAPIDATHPPEAISIQIATGEKIVLRVLNLSTYNSKLKDHVEGQPEFDSDQELKKFYLNTNFEMY